MMMVEIGSALVVERVPALSGFAAIAIVVAVLLLIAGAYIVGLVRGFGQAMEIFHESHFPDHDHEEGR